MAAWRHLERRRGTLLLPMYLPPRLIDLVMGPHQQPKGEVINEAFCDPLWKHLSGSSSELQWHSYLLS